MNLNEVQNHARENSKYISLRDGESVTGRFTGNFDAKEGDFGGKKYIKYEGEFETAGKMKILSLSWGRLKKCQTILKMKGLKLEQAILTITKIGDGQGSDLLFEVVGGANHANFAQAKAMLKDNDQIDDPEIDGVPF